MLLAELYGKLKGRFACNDCGNEEAMNLEAATVVEDALTSSVLCALRYLPPEIGTVPLLRHLDLGPDKDVRVDIRPWPRESVRVLRLDEHTPREVGCEPDVVIEAGSALVVVEAKLGAPLGGDPMQLPQEAVVAHRLAAGRPWRLLCITDHQAAPQIRSFRLVDGAVRTDKLAQAGDAVASYFEAARQVGQHQDWPTPETVRENFRWISWHRLATLLEQVRDQDSCPPYADALLGDLLELLRMRGLHVEPFRGFRNIPLHITPWPAGEWLLTTQSVGKPRLFASLYTASLAWTEGTWLARSKHKEPEKGGRR